MSMQYPQYPQWWYNLKKDIFVWWEKGLYLLGLGVRVDPDADTVLNEHKTLY